MALFFCFSGTKVIANTASINGDPVQFSGLVMTKDSLVPIPFVSIWIHKRYTGTISDLNGFYSMVAMPGDTIHYKVLGFKKHTVVVPEVMLTNHYSVLVTLERDTFDLRESVVYPWPSKENFRDAFLRLDLPDDDMDRARKNMEMSLIKDMAQSMASTGDDGYRMFMQNYYKQLYYAGQPAYNQAIGGVPIPPSLLSPVAWSQFIKALKNGDFKAK